LDEYNAPVNPLKEVFGIKDSKLTLAEKACFAKEGLAWLRPLAEINKTILDDWEFQMPAVAAIQEVTLSKDATVVLPFANGKPAALEQRYGKGKAILYAFFPGCAFVRNAIPRRPFERGTSDRSFNHFLPKQFNPSPPALIMSQASSDSSAPVWSEEEVPGSKYPPSVDVTIIDSPGGIVVPIANYSGKDFKEVTVTVRTKDEFKKIYAARAGELKAERKGDTLTVKLPLAWADMIIFRK